MDRDDISIRPFASDDARGVLDLLSTSLGWRSDDHHARFFSWKHLDNPFGPSLAWIAEREGRLVGFRAFLRWEFEQDGSVVKAVRAVDTATAAEARGSGVFSRLTRQGLNALPHAGVAFVFNTPNDQSRPGYLKMGWQEVGSVPLRVRLASMGALPRLAGARTAADLWSVPTNAAQPAAEALKDRIAVAALLRSQPAAASLRTRLTADMLWWRYAGFPALAYRACAGAEGVAAGLAVFRLRRRGTAIEAMIGHVLAPGGDPAVAAALARKVLRVSGADYAVATATARWRGFVRLPRQGPVLAWRDAGASDRPPPLAAWDLSLGDIELF